MLIDFPSSRSSLPSVLCFLLARSLPSLPPSLSPLSLTLPSLLPLSFSSRLRLFDIPALPNDTRLSLFRDFTQNTYRSDRNSVTLLFLSAIDVLPTLFLFYLCILETAIFNRYKCPILPIYIFPQCSGRSTSSNGERASIFSRTLAFPGSTEVRVYDRVGLSIHAGRFLRFIRHTVGS